MLQLEVGKCYALADLGMGHVRITYYDSGTGLFSGEWYYKDSVSTCKNYWISNGTCVGCSLIDFTLVQECSMIGEFDYVDDSYWDKYKTNKYNIDKEEPCDCGSYYGRDSNWEHKPDCKYLKWKKWRDSELKKRKEQ